MSRAPVRFQLGPFTFGYPEERNQAIRSFGEAKRITVLHVVKFNSSLVANNSPFPYYLSPNVLVLGEPIIGWKYIPHDSGLARATQIRTWIFLPVYTEIRFPWIYKPHLRTFLWVAFKFRLSFAMKIPIVSLDFLSFTFLRGIFTFSAWMTVKFESAFLPL